MMILRQEHETITICHHFGGNRDIYIDVHHTGKTTQIMWWMFRDCSLRIVFIVHGCNEVVLDVLPRGLFGPKAILLRLNDDRCHLCCSKLCHTVH